MVPVWENRMSAHVSQNSISLWDPSQGTSLSCTQSRMISFKLKPLVSSKAAESPATRIQVSTSHFRCLSLSVIRRRTIYACQCECNEMERACSNTRDVRGGAMSVRYARSKCSTRKVAYAAHPFSIQVHSSPTVLVMCSSQSFAGSL